jgi:hypothetical protein
VLWGWGFRVCESEEEEQGFVRNWAKIESERKIGCFNFLGEERFQAIMSISTMTIVFNSFFFFFIFWDYKGFKSRAEPGYLVSGDELI